MILSLFILISATPIKLDKFINMHLMVRKFLFDISKKTQEKNKHIKTKDFVFVRNNIHISSGKSGLWFYL